MAKGPSYKLPHRRRREKKTNYDRRLALLKSGKKRLVVRKHNKSIIAQIVEYNGEDDNTIGAVNSIELRGLGWNGHNANLPSAYLTGYLLGLKFRGDVKEAVLDIGLQNSSKGNLIYATVKGVKDAGIHIPCSEEVIPSEDRIKGEHVVEYTKEMDKKEKEEKFSKCIERGLDPEDLSEHFLQIKDKIGEKYG
ncbi:MAG: 50S ribosomal protein L18 [Candidatus Aenigmatarchaeota archaeon]